MFARTRLKRIANEVMHHLNAEGAFGYSPIVAQRKWRLAPSELSELEDLLPNHVVTMPFIAQFPNRDEVYWITFGSNIASAWENASKTLKSFLEDEETREFGTAFLRILTNDRLRLEKKFGAVLSDIDCPAAGGSI